MKEINEKLDKIVDKMHSIDKTLVKQEENLKQHMYRTKLAEQRLDNIDTDLKPIKNHVQRLNGAWRFVKYTGTILSVVFLAYKLISGK